MKKLTLKGIQIPIDRSVFSDKMIEVIKNGSYEYEESYSLPDIIQNGERIVELGGGIGYISSIAWKTERVDSLTVIEANPDLIPVIRKTHELNGVPSTIINSVVTPQKEKDTLPFYIREDFWASSLSAEPWSYERKVDVPTISWAEILKEHAPTMIICDIEGGESILFDSIPLTGVKKVYIEVHQNVLGRVGVKRLFDFFSEKDFHYDVYHSSRNVILFSHVLR